METQIEWLNTKAYFLEHGTKPEIVKLRTEGTFAEWTMLSLQQIAKHNKFMTLKAIYSDLLDAWYIANRSKPILMDSMTCGEWFRWYEINVMPKLN